MSARAKKIAILGVQQATLVRLRGPLIRDLVAAGHQVTGLAPEPEAVWSEHLTGMGVVYVPVPMQRAGTNPFADVFFAVWLWFWLVKNQPDVILSCQTKAVIYGSLASWLARIPRRVAMIEGLGRAFTPQRDAGFVRWLVNWINPLLYLLFLRCADTVFFLNPDDLAEFRKRHMLTKRQRIIEIPGIGVDLVHYAPKPIPSGSFTVLMVSRLLADKGIREYLAAARLVRQKRPDIRFLLYGRPEQGAGSVPEEEVRDCADVVYLGETGDVRPYLAECHLYALPSYREGMPLSVMEAMATGRAIVTTDVPGARETVVDGQNGYLVKPGDPGALAGAILNLAGRPDLVAAMGQAGRAMAEARYEVGQINRRVISAIVGDT